MDESTRRALRRAELASPGHTARQTAQMLFVTRKTIEFHLHQSYTKLGFCCREQLTEAFAEHDAAKHAS